MENSAIPSNPTQKTLIAFSSGKDAAWTLHVLRQRADVEIVGLFTTFNESADRVSMHAVRRELVEAQADAAGLPLWPVFLPFPCSNADYEARMATALEEYRGQGVTHIAFGDLHLADVRQYRERQLAGAGITPLFPLWGTPADTPHLARAMIDAGVKALLTCVDPKQLDERFAGRQFDRELLDELPPEVDPCGENGEFHTFCNAGPMFAREIPVRLGEKVVRDGFQFVDVLPGSG